MSTKSETTQTGIAISPLFSHRVIRKNSPSKTRVALRVLLFMLSMSNMRGIIAIQGCLLDVWCNPTKALPSAESLVSHAEMALRSTISVGCCGECRGLQKVLLAGRMPRWNAKWSFGSWWLNLGFTKDEYWCWVAPLHSNRRPGVPLPPSSFARFINRGFAITQDAFGHTFMTRMSEG